MAGGGGRGGVREGADCCGAGRAGLARHWWGASDGLGGSARGGKWRAGEGEAVLSCRAAPICAWAHGRMGGGSR